MTHAKGKIGVALISISIIFSILSQISAAPEFVRLGMYVFWILSLLYYICYHQYVIVLSRFTKYFAVVYTIFLLYCCICDLFSSTNHLDGNYLQIMRIPLLVSIIGDVAKDSLSIKDLQKIGKVYFLLAFLFAIWVQVKYFPSYSAFLNQVIYLFKQKNSAAQIWSSAILINLFLLKYKNKFMKIASFVASVYMLVLIAFCQCRTAILALGVVLLAYIGVSSKHKAKWIIGVAIVAVIALRFHSVQEFIKQALSINKYENEDLNTFSSGRLELWSKALSVFIQSPLTGCGKYYVDCSYLCVLAESGIIGFGLIESVWLFRIVSNFKIGLQDNRGKLLGYMTIFYIVESMLEGFPPFGPGVSSFMLWFLSAFLIYTNHNEEL